MAKTKSGRRFRIGASVVDRMEERRERLDHLAEQRDRQMGQFTSLMERLVKVLEDQPQVNRVEPDQGFKKELESLINRHSMENGSGTPDFILANYLCDCLRAFDAAVGARKQWYMPGVPPTLKGE